MLKAATGTGGGGWYTEQGTCVHKSSGHMSNVFCSLMPLDLGYKTLVIRGPAFPSLG